MSRLSDLSASPMLRQYAQGAAQTNVQPVADFLAPTIPVATSVGRYKVYTEKNRFHLPETLRGIGGRATEVSFDASDQTFNCEPHALDFPVDNLEQLEEAGLENALQEGADQIAEIAGLAHEKNVIDAALTALGSGTAVTFGTSDDPVDILDQHIVNVIKAAKYGSLLGVGIIFGVSAWRKFKNNTNVRDKFVVGSGGSPALAIPSPAGVGAMFLSNPEVRVSSMVYDSAQEGLSESISFILDNDVIIFARRPNPTRRDPSFMKTFRLAGRFMVPGSYTRDDGRVEVAKFDWSEDIKVTNSSAGVRLVVG